MGWADKRSRRKKFGLPHVAWSKFPGLLSIMLSQSEPKVHFTHCFFGQLLWRLSQIFDLILICIPRNTFCPISSLKTIFFVLLRFSFRGIDYSQESRGKERIISYLPTAHEHSEIYLQFLRDDCFVFLIAASVITTLLHNKNYSPLYISIWSTVNYIFQAKLGDGP